MSFASVAVLAGIGLFLGMLVAFEVGRRRGVGRRATDPEGAFEGTGAVDGAVFALLGLVIAFTFSGAAARFDARRQLVVEEANAIGTAYLRIDLLPESSRPALRDLFRQYVDSRIETYRKIPIWTRPERRWTTRGGCKRRSGSGRSLQAGWRACPRRPRCCSCPP